MEQRFHDVADERKALVHAVGKCLNGVVLPIDVDDETGEEIAFAVDKPVGVCARKKLRPQLVRGFDPAPEEMKIYLFAFAREQSNGNERVRVEESRAEWLASACSQLDDIARPGFAVDGLEFIAERPEMSGDDAALLVFLQRYDLVQLDLRGLWDLRDLLTSHRYHAT